MKKIILVAVLVSLFGCASEPPVSQYSHHMVRAWKDKDGVVHLTDYGGVDPIQTITFGNEYKSPIDPKTGAMRTYK